MNIPRLFTARRHLCRHPSDCPNPASRDQLMCDAHAADETLTVHADNRLAPWDLVRRRHTWPAWKGHRNG